MSHERDSLERAVPEKPTLISFLSNPLILEHTAPYLPVVSLLSLSATSRDFRDLINHSPRAFRYLDLSQVKAAQFQIAPIDNGGEVWRNVQLDENLTEDDFYSGPLRGIFSNLQRRSFLQNVYTLILDGLSVTAELVHDILIDPSFNVRILSIREAQNLNEHKLCASLRYVCRPSRPDPENTPRLKALYVFGSRDPVPADPETNTNALNLTNNNNTAADAWYVRKGRVLPRAISIAWAETMQVCSGLIAFDALLCTGPRHVTSRAFGAVPGLESSSAPSAVATVALGPCSGCGTAPEELTYYNQHSSRDLPALAPVPAFSSTARAAKRPQVYNGKPEEQSFVARCVECARLRHCEACRQWWCENCYQGPDSVAAPEPIIVDTDYSGLSLELMGLGTDAEGFVYTPKKTSPVVSRSCWECGINCTDCIEKTQLYCKGCRGGYCLIHNEGSTHTHCDWCSYRGNRLARRELY